MKDLWIALCSGNGFLPHGHCYFWQPGILWLHVLSDSFIALAYFSIPLSIAYFVKRREDIKAFQGIFLLYVAFILLCGSTHILEVFTVWEPVYIASGAVKFLTAVVSIITAVVMWRIIPKALSIPGITQLRQVNQSLEAEIKAKNAAKLELQKHKDDLEKIVKQRTAELENTTERLRNEIARHKEAQKKIQFQASILDQVQNGVIVVDNDNHVVYVNKFSEQMFGYPAEEFIGQNVNDLVVVKGQKKLISEAEEEIKTSDYWLGEFYGKTKSGQAFPLLSTTSVLRNEHGEIEGRVGINMDITGKKQAEEELRSAKEKAEESARAKQHFLSVMSHEIRTPLNAVIGLSQLLIKNNPKTSQQKYLNALGSSANNLLSLVNDILDYSKIESGKILLQKTAFNIETLAEQVFQGFYYRTESKPIELIKNVDPEIPEWLIGDSGRLSQVLINLMGNAIKFTEQGHVTMTIAQVKDRREGILLHFSVEDTGLGISEEKQKTIFDSFTQEDASINQKYGGTGLGLSICKNLIQLMGGNLQVKSTKGYGTTFYFSLQLTKAENLESQDEASLNHNTLDGVRILLVEDNHFNQLVISEFLKEWQIEVDLASDGIEAVNKAKANAYDMILMDIQMPEMNGLQACQSIRKGASLNQEVPIIALTADIQEDTRRQIFDSGMNEVIIKPVSSTEMHTKITLNLDKQLTQNQKEKYLTLKELIKKYEGDRNFRDQLILTIRAHFREIGRQLRVIVEQENLESLRKLIHKLKPSAMRLENEQIIKDMYELKQMLLDKSSQSLINSQIKKIERESTRILTYLNKLATLSE